MVILDKTKLPDATMDDLKETFLAVTGQSLETENIDAARVKVSMALLASADAVGHLGVPRDTQPQPMTIEQLRSKGKQMGKEEQVEQEITRFKPGSLAAQLLAAQQAMPKIEPRQPRRNSGEPRSKIEYVKATFTGTSKPQAGSLRSQVLKHIQENSERDQPTEIDAMESALGFPVRGHVQKLIEKDHVVAVKDTQEGEQE